MIWKYVTTAVVAMIVGAAVSPIVMHLVARYAFADAQNDLFQRFSSEGKEWPKVTSFIEAGGRAYWSPEAILNNIQKGTDEEEIRHLIGPPDAVLVGRDEVARSFKLGVQVATSGSHDRKRPLDYIPYLERDTAGLYVYKMGRLARSTTDIELHVLYVELSASGRLTESYRIPVSPSNPIGDFAMDTRSERHVRSK